MITRVIFAYGTPCKKAQNSLCMSSIVHELRQNFTRLACFVMSDTLPLSNTAPGFICDVHLGKLARRLRLLGFDTIYRNDLGDEEIIQIAEKEHRIILTRDGEILNNKTTQRYRPNSIFFNEQVREVLSVFNLREQIRPFSRCIKCNGEIIPVDKNSVIALVPPRSGQFMEYYWQCQACRKIYWHGSHYNSLRNWVDEVMESGF
jgi:uncharacterized protein